MKKPPTAPPADPTFWQRKTLAGMSPAEWESLCDGCGRCCLNKLEDEDTGEIFFTDVGCRLLDSHSCRCGDYANRTTVVDDCMQLTPENVGELAWLPPTCAYKLLAEGRNLYPWHPLVSGDPESVHAAGVSVRARVVAHEDQISEQELEDHIVAWPGETPAASKAKKKKKSRG